MQIKTPAKSQENSLHYIQETAELSNTEGLSYDLFTIQDKTHEPTDHYSDRTQWSPTDYGTNWTLVHRILISQDDQCAELENTDVQL